ncbi:hypothetical protein TNCV_1468361 [Trichonephila clavipes]|uniref:Uncharacterized protein n=1 Tax=Trichonephila clavipes TaxID=2585209 RepID=A0A8X6S7E6_TRICX|nr:hypothetical protein TNCV_1468361 [Trichonephila clavipes]
MLPQFYLGWALSSHNLAHSRALTRDGHNSRKRTKEKKEQLHIAAGFINLAEWVHIVHRRSHRSTSLCVDYAEDLTRLARRRKFLLNILSWWCYFSIVGFFTRVKFCLWFGLGGRMRYWVLSGGATCLVMECKSN